MNLLLAEVAQATQRLAAAGVPSPRFDAEELAAFVHGVSNGGNCTTSRTRTSTPGTGRPSPAARRASRSSTSPAAPSSGTWSCRSGPGVFVPRPGDRVGRGLGHTGPSGRWTWSSR